MANPHFIGLVQALVSSADAALGELHSPLVTRMARDGVLARKTAQKSLSLLAMLHEKTQGNLDATERDALHTAVKRLQERLAALPPEDGAAEA
jgi:hypothetical protein